MGILKYSINVTLDGCVDHRAVDPTEESHLHAMEDLAGADALLFGRITYQMMEDAWRAPRQAGAMPDWTEPFAITIDGAKKYVVSSSLPRVDWNAERVTGDLESAVRQLKEEAHAYLLVGGVTLPLALADLRLIDEYEFVVHPVIAGHGPRLLDGLSTRFTLQPVSRREFSSGAVATRYVPQY